MKKIYPRLASLSLLILIISFAFYSCKNSAECTPGGTCKEKAPDRSVSVVMAGIAVDFKAWDMENITLASVKKAVPNIDMQKMLQHFSTTGGELRKPETLIASALILNRKISDHDSAGLNDIIGAIFYNKIRDNKMSCTVYKKTNSGFVIVNDQTENVEYIFVKKFYDVAEMLGGKSPVTILDIAILNGN